MADTTKIPNQTVSAPAPGEPGEPRGAGGIPNNNSGQDIESRVRRRIADLTDMYLVAVNKDAAGIKKAAAVGGNLYDSLFLGDPRYDNYVASIVQRIRSPWVLTCSSWIKNGIYIVFRVNPSNVSWRIPVRGNEQMVKSGRIQHVRRNETKKTFLSEPEIDITFHTGNIMPIRLNPPIQKGTKGGFPIPNVKSNLQAPGQEFFTDFNVNASRVPSLQKDTREKVSIPQGVWNFYMFLALVDEQKILEDGTQNLIYLYYHSNTFPAIILSGLFNPSNGISFTDSSNTPNGLEWNATFTVYNSTPQLGSDGFDRLRQDFVKYKFRDL